MTITTHLAQALSCRHLAPPLPNAQSVSERIGQRSHHVRPPPISVRAHHTTPRLLLPRSRRHMVCKEETSLLTFPRGFVNLLRLRHATDEQVSRSGST